MLVSSSCNYSCTLRALVQRTGKHPCRTLAVPGQMLAAAVLAGLCALFAPAFAAATPIARIARACPGATIAPNAADAPTVERATLCMVNRIRSIHRLTPLHANSTLGSVAASQVASMVRLDYFADVRPSGTTPLALVSSTGYARSAYVSIGQNIAWGTGGDAAARTIVAAWMNSPPHRHIVLNGAFRDAGVAVIPAVPAVVGATAKPAATYAMEFGVRRP